jgi:hypothetical protein
MPPHRPFPPWDPGPWGDPAFHWRWKHVPFPDPGDPIPFPYRFVEQIRIEDWISLRMATLDAMQEVFKAQMSSERALLVKQQEILGKYK